MYDKNQKTYVVGHKSPDTDAIVSALVYAAFLADTGHDVEPVALGEANTETKFVLEYAGIDMPMIVESLPEGSHVVLVDHNEEKQSIEDRHLHEIKGVVDHHKFGGFSTNKPLHMRVEALGSTASILSKIFDEKNYVPSQQLATLMISAILSDTLHFRSPTTTEEDKEIVKKLNEIAQIENLEDFSMKMFDAKSDLGDISASELVQVDYKLFEFGDLKSGIGVIETTNPGYALGRKDELVEAIRVIKEDANLDFLLLCVVDILNEKNTCIVADDIEVDVVQKAFGADTNDHLASIGNRVSRKKTIVPPIAEALS